MSYTYAPVVKIPKMSGNVLLVDLLEHTEKLALPGFGTFYRFFPNFVWKKYGSPYRVWVVLIYATPLYVFFVLPLR